MENIDDLNRAVEATTWVVDTTPQNHPDRAGRLNNLGSLLGRRFERTGSMDDLNRAVEAVTQAVDAAPQDYPNRALYFNNLGNSLGRRFKRTGSIDYLNRAVEAATEAVDATPQDHPDRAGFLSNLGNWLGARFERTGSVDDLNRAVEAATKAVDATPQDHPDRAGRLNNLGSWLGTRFERTGSMDDLNRAVEATTQAVDTTPQDHLDRALYFNNLGNSLGRRFKRTGSVDDLNRARSSYEDGWDCQLAAPSIRIKCARAAADIASSQGNWIKSSELLQQAVRLLPTLSPRSLKHTDTQHALASFAGMASNAAAITLCAGKEAHHTLIREDIYQALQLLELGRGVIAGSLMDMRGDISDLKLQHPDLAREFIFLRDQLDSPADEKSSLNFTENMSSWESRASRRRQADEQFKKLIKKIGGRRGFENFLQPPTAEELMSAADPDPIIVINLSSYRSDAFLVKHDCITVKELPALKPEEVEEKLNHLQIFLEELENDEEHSSPLPLLEWLWNTICRPCLDELGFKDCVPDDNWPRVWWVPTGLVSQLPLHAAGLHAHKSADTVLYRVMSSYASSIKALLHGRRNKAQAQPDSALLVAMRDTPDRRKLESAPSEMKLVEGLCPSIGLKPVKPLSRKEDVLKELQTCKVFHFAGHGELDPAEPSQSRLLLEDWQTSPLTVGDLRNTRLQQHPPFLAYLSACSTGANKAVKLADEGIHLVSAFQLAGFRHVVGTLWEVSDRCCVDVARIFYETLQEEGMTDVAVCRGLHRAIRALWQDEISADEDAGDWIPFVHFGV